MKIEHTTHGSGPLRFVLEIVLLNGFFVSLIASLSLLVRYATREKNPSGAKPGSRLLSTFEQIGDSSDPVSNTDEKL